MSSDLGSSNDGDILVDGYGVKQGVGVQQWPSQSVVMASVTYNWPLTHVSRLLDETCISDMFTVAGYTWRMKFCANAMHKNKDSKEDASASFFIECVECNGKCKGPIAAFSLGVVNQEYPGKSLWRPCEHAFTTKQPDWGFQRMILLEDLIDPVRGFVVNDVLVLGVRF